MKTTRHHRPMGLILGLVFARARQSMYLLSTIILTLLLNACATNPVTGKRELTLISQSQEIEIGKNNYLPTRQAQGGSFYLDPDLTDYIGKIGKTLSKYSDRPKLPYEFVVLNNSVPNAWALPGGKIAINRGLLVELDNEAELAAVLGHEITHAAARHSAKTLERNLLLQTTLIGLAVTIDENSMRDLLVGAGLLGTQLISQKYGRDAELEADRYGMRYLVRSGYDANAAVSLQETFVKLAQGRRQNWLEGLFSSHPPSQERVKANIKTARKLGNDGNLNREEYQKHIAKLKNLTPALNKLDQAQLALNKKNMDQAVKLAREVSSKHPEIAMAYGIEGAVMYHKKQYTQALSSFSKALQRNQNYFQYYLQRGLTYQAMDKPDEAKLDLEKSNQLLPTALAHNGLGEIAKQKGQTEQARKHFEIASGSRSPAGQQARDNLLTLPKQGESNKK